MVLIMAEPERPTATPSEEADASTLSAPHPPPHASSPPSPAAAAAVADEAAVTAPSGSVAAAAATTSSTHAATSASSRAAVVDDAATDGAPLGAYEALARSAKLPDLVALALDIVGGAATARRADVPAPSRVQNHVELARLARSDADTPYGNALKVLEVGPEGAAERALAQALWAHAVAEAPRARVEDEDRLAADVLWLSAHTPFDATPLLDRALGEEAGELWTAIADRVKRIDDGRGAALGRAEALVGCAALGTSSSPVAAKLRTTLAAQLRDPVLVRILDATEHADAAGELHLAAELVTAPRGPIATTILAFTGILFVLRAVDILARLALAYRRPAEVSLTSAGVRVRSRTEMLGKTLREREHVIVRSGLVRVVREVRYPRAAFYAGLLALVLGSYVGVRALVDGVRAASPSLLLVGLVIIALGVAADFVLGSVLPGAKGRCRIAFVPASGPTVWLGNVDARRADDVLTRALASR